MAAVTALPTQVRHLVRHPERTRARILAASLAEFAAHGYAGTRVDRIARRARVNKRMLYHYFGSKDGLFRAVLGRKLGERAAWITATPDDPAETLPYWFGLVYSEPEWIRLLEWEALEMGSGAVSRETERRHRLQQAVELLRDRQARGHLRSDVDPRHLLLAMMGLTMLPLAFPQLTRLVTGLRPMEPAFRRQRVEFLRQFAEALRPKRWRRQRRKGAPHGGRS